MTSQSRKAGLEKLEIVLSASAFWRGGRKGGSGGIPPAEPVNKIGSDFFKYTPPDRATEMPSLITVVLRYPSKIVNLWRFFVFLFL